jgi:DNA-binding transcriptional ArsR family regulator
MEAAFKAINDVTRREILQFLIQGPQNAGQIAKQFDMTKPSISHHLDLLKQAQLIDAVKKGQFIHKKGFESIHQWFQGFAQHFEFPKPKIRL